MKTDQEGCAIAASDINAANGIASVSTIAEAYGHDQRREPVAVKDVNAGLGEIPVENDEKINADSVAPVEVASGQVKQVTEAIAKSDGKKILLVSPVSNDIYKTSENSKVSDDQEAVKRAVELPEASTKNIVSSQVTVNPLLPP